MDQLLLNPQYCSLTIPKTIRIYYILIFFNFHIFSLSSADETGTGNLRKRNIPEESNDLDYLLKAHHQAQEQVAEEMLSLTKSLKEQSLAAKEVIGKILAETEVEYLKNENFYVKMTHFLFFS